MGVLPEPANTFCAISLSRSFFAQEITDVLLLDSRLVAVTNAVVSLCRSVRCVLGGSGKPQVFWPVVGAIAVNVIDLHFARVLAVCDRPDNPVQRVALVIELHEPVAIGTFVTWHGPGLEAGPVHPPHKNPIAQLVQAPQLLKRR
jgi:hypothetical protein